MLIQVMALAGLVCALISCASPSPAVPPSPTPAPTAFSPLPTPVPSEVSPPNPAMSSGAAAPSTVEPPPILSTPAPSQQVEHTVQPGETLLQLALEYGVPMVAIQLQNQLGSDTSLQAGQLLEIPPAAEWEEASPFWVVALVEEGGTLSGIAALYGLDLATLRAVNGLTDGDLLRVGQPLILPLDAPAEALASVPEPTPTPASPPPATAAPTEPAAVAAASSPLTSSEPPAEIAAWPAEVLRLINAVRAEHGLPPYAYNETLAQAAWLHGQDCLARGWCGHTGSDGSNVETRIERAGYDASGWAECIVYSSSPQQAVDWWMDEVPPNDAHRRTLLSAWVTEIGIAVVPTGQGTTHYFIADFGRP